MSWIAIAAPDRNWMCPERFDAAMTAQMNGLTRGSILLEAQLVHSPRSRTLIHLTRAGGQREALSLRTTSDGRVCLSVDTGDALAEVTLAVTKPDRSNIVRATYSWDIAQHWGRLTVENPGEVGMAVQETAPPPMLTHADLMAFFQSANVTTGLEFLAISDGIEPVGPMPSLMGDVPVATPRGYVPVQDLRRGDTVVTGDHQVVPVLHVVQRTVPAFGSFQPVRLKAPWFGLQRDILVSPDQCLLIGGTEVSYMFGRDTVRVPAGNLINGTAAHRASGPMTVRYHQALLPGHEALLTADAALESLYVGRLRRSRGHLAATLLGDCPSGLMPEQASASYRVLSAFEAMTLAQARAA